jgi:menaquinone-specific isochorismate synthase
VASRHTQTEIQAGNALKLISVGVPCPGVDVDMFLSAAHGGARFMWRNPNDLRVFAGAGIVNEISGWGAGRYEQVERAARELFDEFSPLSTAEPRLFGGFAFRDDFVPDLAWAEFPPAHFVLPHFQFESSQTGADCRLSINAQAPAQDINDELIDAMRAALFAKRDALLNERANQTGLARPLHSNPVSQRALVNFAAWRRMIASARTQMHNTPLRKVVLARTEELCFDNAAPVDAALTRLNGEYPETYRFVFEPASGRAFFGATPELLAAKTGDSLRTMALAGSIQRGKGPHEDFELKRQLIASKKDRLEHQIVVDDIFERLSTLSSAAPQVGETGVLAFKNIHHLHTALAVELTRPLSLFDIVSELHPTSALGGQPRELALPLISELEPVTRGWYAAPIGWVDRHLDGEFGVAIRSAIAQDNRVWLYAGCGIVAASEAEYEWRETLMKLAPMERALNAEGSRAS